jgi:hypothetical protein
MHPVASLALEWWRAEAERDRTRQKLLEFVDHFAHGFGAVGELRREIERQALQAAGLPRPGKGD